MPRRPPQNTLHTREEFFAREATAWAAFIATWTDLPDDAFLVHGACGGGWNIKDVMNHIATWQEAAIRIINDLQAGRWARLGPHVEAFNAHHYAADQSRTLDESRVRLHQTHHTLLALLSTLSDEQLLNEYGRQKMGWWAKWTTYAHYEQHMAELVAFRHQVQVVKLQ